MSIDLSGLGKTLSAGHVIAPHAHEAHQIVHGLGGVMRVADDDAMWLLPPGRALWMPAGRVHSIECRDLVELRTVYLTGNDAVFPTHPTLGRVSPLMRELMVRVAAGAPAVQIPHITALLLAEVKEMGKEPWQLPLDRNGVSGCLVETILTTPDDSASLSDWAWELGLSPRTFMRRLQRETGMNFREYRRQIRLLASIERLLADDSITDVAHAVGFDSSSAFSHAFRLSTGMTPSAFRARSRA